MSLKQFPSSPSGKSKNMPPRMVAALFDPLRAWEMINKRREGLHEEVDVGGFGNIGRGAAEQIANSAGIRITKGFSISKAVEIFRKSKFREIQAYALFLLLFTVSTYYNRNAEQGNYLQSSVQGVLFNTKFLAAGSGQFITFQDIDSIEDFWDFLEECFLSNLFLPTSDRNSSGLQYLTKYNRIIQPIRIRQLRVNSVSVESCDVSSDMIDAGVDFQCWPAYSPQGENRSDILGWPPGTSMTYQSAESIETMSYGKGAISVYSGGGFVLDVPLGTMKGDIEQIFEYLKQNQYIDLATRAVFVDLCLYNPSVQFFISVRMLFEFLPYGDVRSSNSVLVMQGAALPNDMADLILFYMDVAVYGLLVLFIFWDLQRILKVGSLHFRAFWNWISVLNYIIFSYTFIQRLLYLSLEPIRMYSNILSTTESMLKVYDFQAVGEQYQYISVLLGTSAFLCWIRILSYFRYFDRNLSLLVSTIGNCATDTVAWFVTLAIVVLAYAQAFYLAFGPEVDGFDTIGQSTGTLCEWLFRNVDTTDIIASDQ